MAEYYPAYKYRDWLYQKYMIEKLSTRRIGKMCGVSDVTISNWMTKLGIKARSLSKAHQGIQAGFVNPNWGKPLSEMQKKQMIEAKIGSKASLKTRKKMSETHKRMYQEGTRKAVWQGKTGDKCPAWKGGLTPKHLIIRCSRKYKEWRDAIFQRDDYTCQYCSARNGNGKAIILQAHHILPFSRYPEKRFDIDNGQTLCKPCHKEVSRGRYPLHHNC